MKAKPDLSLRRLAGLPARLPELLGLTRKTALVGLACFACAAFAAIVFANIAENRDRSYGDIEVGRVADRDVVAGYRLSYTDREATRARTEAQLAAVPAVFRYRQAVRAESLARWDDFASRAAVLTDEGTRPETAATELRARFPELPERGILAFLTLLAGNPDAAGAERELLESVLALRIFDLGKVDLGRHDPEFVELLTVREGGMERERMPRERMLFPADVAGAIESGAVSGTVRQGLTELLAGFVNPNAVFSEEDTGFRLAEAAERVQPVTRTVEQGQRIIRQGFIVTEQELADLEALRAAHPLSAPGGQLGKALLLALPFLLVVLLQGRPVLGRELPEAQGCLLFLLMFLYLVGTAFARHFLTVPQDFPMAVFFPTALLVMIASVFSGHLAAFILALVFPLSAAVAGFIDMPGYVFSLVSGISASVVLRKAERRMDLINAGTRIAAANCLAVLVILLMRAAPLSAFPPLLLAAALNGIGCGMLSLGALAPLEGLLNAPTRFRLMELSDLNAPILRKLFTAAPGTYSHSMLVANLAEQACRDIGANALLARVASYYHDVGKMDNPGYFVENQTDHNRHDDISPRLSATVIRSHLKLGVEKARQLGLPEDVIDIIAEHHGNSLIVWFHKKAEDLEGQVNTEDFTYPGTPPRSRESAVVMLADVSEAAVRTLVKPTVAKMEKFIQQLFDSKIEHGQLALCDLTFRELEVIKNAFVKVLAGYHHSRIEYPKAAEGEA